VNGANGVRQRDRESSTDSDPHGLLFGSDDDAGFFDGDHTGPLPRVQRVSRRDLRSERGRRASRRRTLAIVGGLLVVAVAVTVAAFVFVYLH
jgi:hypothetical protein